jgi:hypothetical protein
MDKKYPKKLRIINGGPWHIKKAPFETIYENPMHPLSVRFREKYHLDNVIAGAKTEFEKFLMLKEWVKRRMRQHGWSFNCLRNKPINALEILECVENGVLFHCLYHAKVFIQCCESLGYPARLVGARMINHEFSGERTGNVGHEIAEVWSNEHRKWIMMDCDTNSYYEKNGVPLSISEICLENHKDSGRHVEMVFGEYRPQMSVDTGGGEKVLGLDKTPEEVKTMGKVFMQNRVLDYYTIVIANSRHDVFSNRYAKPQVLSFAPRHINPMLVYNNDPYFESDFWTNEESVFNWSVNEVAIRLKIMNNALPYVPLIASFENSMPNFDHYEWMTDEDENWKRCADVVLWDIRKGKNNMKVRAVNTMGIAGPDASASVLFEP